MEHTVINTARAITTGICLPSHPDRFSPSIGSYPSSPGQIYCRPALTIDDVIDTTWVIHNILGYHADFAQYTVYAHTFKKQVPNSLFSSGDRFPGAESLWNLL